MGDAKRKTLLNGTILTPADIAPPQADESVAVSVGTSRDLTAVILQFAGEPVNWLAMPVATARQLAAMLIAKADMVEAAIAQAPEPPREDSLT